MKRHTNTTTAGPPGAVGAPEQVCVEPDPPAAAAGGSVPVLTSVDTWHHTLVLTGELTHRSAHALEVEIERLCENGVTDITLDLRQLETIDPVGVAVIAFRCGLCEKRGYGFGLVPGPRRVQTAFEQAGVLGMLPFREVVARGARESEFGALEG